MKLMDIWLKRWAELEEKEEALRKAQEKLQREWDALKEEMKRGLIKNEQ